MKIYTKKGDAGETGLFGGSRVSKDHARIQAYGTLDELNSMLGLALCHKKVGTAYEQLERIQAELFQLGAELATPSNRATGITPIGVAEIQQLEASIDQMEKSLPKLQTFILPGGCLMASTLHLSRTICRRAEREIVALNHLEPLRPETLQYVNRLSDYLFVAARFANLENQIADIPWTPKK